MCIFNSKKDIEVFIKKVAKIASEHNIPIGNNTLMLLKSISLYLYYNCGEEDRSVLSIDKLLNCCFEVGCLQTTFEIMLSWPDINSKPFQAYEKFIAAVGSNQSTEYYRAVIECQYVMSLYCKQEA